MNFEDIVLNKIKRLFDPNDNYDIPLTARNLRRINDYFNASGASPTGIGLLKAIIPTSMAYIESLELLTPPMKKQIQRNLDATKNEGDGGAIPKRTTKPKKQTTTTTRRRAESIAPETILPERRGQLGDLKAKLERFQENFVLPKNNFSIQINNNNYPIFDQYFQNLPHSGRLNGEHELIYKIYNVDTHVYGFKPNTSNKSIINKEMKKNMEMMLKENDKGEHLRNKFLSDESKKRFDLNVNKYDIDKLKKLRCIEYFYKFDNMAAFMNDLSKTILKEYIMHRDTNRFKNYNAGFLSFPVKSLMYFIFNRIKREEVEGSIKPTHFPWNIDNYFERSPPFNNNDDDDAKIIVEGNTCQKRTNIKFECSDALTNKYMFKKVFGQQNLIPFIVLVNTEICYTQMRNTKTEILMLKCKNHNEKRYMIIVRRSENYTHEDNIKTMLKFIHFNMKEMVKTAKFRNADYVFLPLITDHWTTTNRCQMLLHENVPFFAMTDQHFKDNDIVCREHFQFSNILNPNKAKYLDNIDKLSNVYNLSSPFSFVLVNEDGVIDTMGFFTGGDQINEEIDECL